MAMGLRSFRLAKLMPAKLPLMALLLSAAASQPAPAQQQASPAPSSDFAHSFAFLAQEPLPPATIPDHAVDLSTIEPPSDTDARPLGTGVASYYGARFAGRLTANGERFDPAQLTAAHRTLPFGSRVRVTNIRNGRSVIVRINDRGPFIEGRTIDLSRTAAGNLGLIRDGFGPVELELLD